MIVQNTVFLLSRALGTIINRLLGIEFNSSEDLFESREEKANFVFLGAGGEVTVLSLEKYLIHPIFPPSLSALA